MAKPIKPNELNIQLPDWIIEGINEAIQSNWRGKSFSIKQKELESILLKHAPEGTTAATIYDNHWMDFEELYRAHGWSVRYSKPSYDESFESYFTIDSNEKNRVS